jgi:hypothetical protein
MPQQDHGPEEASRDGRSIFLRNMDFSFLEERGGGGALLGARGRGQWEKAPFV